MSFSTSEEVLLRLRLRGESLLRDIKESTEAKAKGKALKDAPPTSTSGNEPNERDEQDEFQTPSNATSPEGSTSF